MVEQNSLERNVFTLEEGSALKSKTQSFDAYNNILVLGS